MRRMTDLTYGGVKVSTTPDGLELTAKITAPQPAEYRLRFEVESANGQRVRPTDGSVSARFYLADQMMYFTVGLPAETSGEQTLHVFVNDQLDVSTPFTITAR